MGGESVLLGLGVCARTGWEIGVLRSRFVSPSFPFLLTLTKPLSHTEPQFPTVK